MKDPILEAFGVCMPTHLLDNPMMRERILRHMDALVDVFREQFSCWSDSLSNLNLNQAILRETVESCMCDLYRLKFFRGIHQEDIHKRAAFFMVWLVRIRPIQIMTDAPARGELFANELLALYFGLNVLDISPKQLAERYPNYMKNLVYLMHFHSYSPEQLASELFLLERNIRETK